MNEKDSHIHQVIDIVIEEASSEFVAITKDGLLGKCKMENCKMARCLLVSQLKYMGYSNTTIASVVNRQEKAIVDILMAAHEYKKASWAYRVADAKCTLRVSEIMGEL